MLNFHGTRAFLRSLVCDWVWTDPFAVSGIPDGPWNIWLSGNYIGVHLPWFDERRTLADHLAAGHSNHNAMGT
jgi:hypothetical protein